MGQVKLPGTNAQAQEQPSPFTVEDFGGLDTKAKRPAIGPKDFFWIENWMPIGPGNMRTLYGEAATPLYTASGALEIINYAFFNIGSTRYAIVFLDDGTADQVAEDGTITTISAVTNTFWDGTGPLPAVAQYQAKYLMIASKVSANAYWAWDGTSLYGLGTLAPQIAITNSGGGSGYSSTPTVTAYGGAGSGATFAPVLNAQGHVTTVDVTNPGSGYDHEDLVTLIFTGGGGDDQARATATVSLTSAGVAQVMVTNGGAKYTSPVIAITGGGGTGAKAIVSGLTNGSITDITVTDPGTGYTSAPTVGITDGGAGTGAAATAVRGRGQITGITVNSGGTGYDGVPDVIISAPNNKDFPSIQAEAYATVVAGAVTAITVTAAGIGYNSASVQLSGGNDSAEAEVSLMPAGISGTTIETYQNRVWVGDETKISYTGADSIRDFSGTNGGGSKPITDSFLREKLVSLKQANGFLYRFGDSSINVISNVQTTTSAVTSFNDSNVDPQIGTAWRDTVVAFGRALVFANPTGIYALYGGAAEKVSSPLDGLFAKASFNTGVAGKTPTSCVATVFGIRVYAMLMTTTDPYTRTLRDIIVCWDGQRWFVYTPNIDYAILAGQEISSELTGWAATATDLYKLFERADDTLTKTFSTKLLAPVSYLMTTAALDVAFLAEDNAGTGGVVSISIDTETGSGTPVDTDVSNFATWYNNSGETVTWQNNALATVEWASSGLSLQVYNDSNYGQFIGATVSTTMEDQTFISLTLLVRPDYSVKAG